MKTKTSRNVTGALPALSWISGASAFPETQGIEDPTAKAPVCLPSPTSLPAQPRQKMPSNEEPRRGR